MRLAGIISSNICELSSTDGNLILILAEKAQELLILSAGGSPC
jgi:hypothetical protein